MLRNLNSLAFTKSCTLLNNFVEMRELLSKLYQDMGGGEVSHAPRSYTIVLTGRCT